MIEKNINKEHFEWSHSVKMWTYISLFFLEFNYEVAIYFQIYFPFFQHCLQDSCSDTSIPIFDKCTLKTDPNKIFCFQVLWYYNFRIRPPHEVISNTGSIIYYTTNKKFYIWNICAEINVENYVKCVFLLKKLNDTGLNALKIN